MNLRLKLSGFFNFIYHHYLKIAAIEQNDGSLYCPGFSQGTQIKKGLA